MCSNRRLSDRRPGFATVMAVMALVAGVALTTAGGASNPVFYPDDPIQVDNDRAFDASGVLPIDASNAWDFIEHTFLERGDRTSVRALNVNTVGEVPDSSWFINRIGRRPMSIDEIVQGANDQDVLNVDGWPIVEGKSQGITPGYRVVDPAGRRYQIKFDPPGNPEMASGAEIIGARFYHAAGYNVVGGWAVDIDPAKIVVAPNAMTVDLTGRKRSMTMGDVVLLLKRAGRLPNGKYRALASRYAEGKHVGYFEYSGTRPDDPNDIFPHEHRRELRGSRVLAAWLNHDDSRGVNSLDMLQGPEGRKFIRHYMFDFGSILGSGTIKPQAPRAGHEYLLEWKPSMLTLLTLGLYVRPWVFIDYPEVARSVGRFESRAFEPTAWKPEYPNPAFDNMQPEDAFWGARLVARFSDEIIRAVVAKARYSEPGAADYIAAMLIERRRKVLRAWLTAVNPVVEPTLDEQGVLRFENAAVAAGVTTPPASYRLQWRRFDNTLGLGEPLGEETTAQEPGATAPAGMLRDREFVAVSIRTLHEEFAHWAQPVTVFFRRTGDRWRAVGIERREATPAVTRRSSSDPTQRLP